MGRSLLDSDLEQAKCERQQMSQAELIVRGVVLPLMVPAALGSVFPLLIVFWFVLAVGVAAFVGRSSFMTAFLLTLTMSYLALSFLACIGMYWVGKKKSFRRKD